MPTPNDPSPDQTRPRPADTPGFEATLDLDVALEDALLRIEPLLPLEQPASVVEHLPDAPQSHAAVLLAELIKIDMAASLEAGRSPRIEAYLVRADGVLTAASAPLDLVLEEYQLRRDAGEEPTHQEYAERFPQHAEVLAQFSRHAATVAAERSDTSDEGLPDLQSGETIDDFQVVQTLGAGAFATVYLARQLSMQRLVALKVSSGRGDEPQALAQFDHPNVVRVYDQRVAEGGVAHLLYMQYLPGGTLAEVVKRVRWASPGTRNGRLLVDAIDDNLLAAAQQPPEGSATRDWLAVAPWPVAVAWVGVQLARALDDAHRRGVLHRDVKPANVLLSAEGTPKLADFNVSFAGAVTGADAAESLGGSIGYMAPEHLLAIGGRPGTRPEDVGASADLYSLAVLLWELWQGRRPFQVFGKAESWSEALTQQSASRNEPLVDPETTDEGSERVLERTLRQTLARAAEDRPRTGAELAGRLRLAMHPDAAGLFDPPERSWRHTVAGVPPMLAATAAILGPNIAAGVFNYFYNAGEIIEGYADTPGMQPAFESLANTVNAIAFPLGALLVVLFAWPVARALRRARGGDGAGQRDNAPPIDAGDLDRLFALPTRAAWLGGALWGVASVVYPVVLTAWFPEFRDSAAHFCASLLVCGGVAAVYPYFALVTWAVAVAYPRLVRPTMADDSFAERGRRLRRDGAGFLLAATAIPLLAIALLVSHESPAVDAIRVAIVATACGVFVAFGVYRYALSCWDRLAPVLGSRQ